MSIESNARAPAERNVYSNEPNNPKVPILLLRQTVCRAQRSLCPNLCNPLIRVNPRFRQVFINSTNQHKSVRATLVVAQLSLDAWRSVNRINTERDQRRPNSETNRNRLTDEQVAQ